MARDEEIKAQLKQMEALSRELVERIPLGGGFGSRSNEALMQQLHASFLRLNGTLRFLEAAPNRGPRPIPQAIRSDFLSD